MNRNRVYHYGIAFSSVFLAFLVYRGLGRLVHGDLPIFITFNPAIMLVALLCGVGPGLAATAVAALVADCWIIQPVGQISASPKDLMSVALFIGMGALMSTVAGRYRQRISELEIRNAQLVEEATELQKAQTALAQSEQRYRGIVENHSVFVSRYLPGGDTYLRQQDPSQAVRM